MPPGWQSYSPTSLAASAMCPSPSILISGIAVSGGSDCCCPRWDWRLNIARESLSSSCHTHSPHHRMATPFSLPQNFQKHCPYPPTQLSPHNLFYNLLDRLCMHTLDCRRPLGFLICCLLQPITSVTPHGTSLASAWANLGRKRPQRRKQQHRTFYSKHFLLQGRFERTGRRTFLGNSTSCAFTIM